MDEQTERIEPGFYGTSEETYFVTASGKIWCVQSPDLEAVGGRPAPCDSLPAGAEQVSDSLCHDIDVSECLADEEGGA